MLRRGSSNSTPHSIYITIRDRAALLVVNESTANYSRLKSGMVYRFLRFFRAVLRLPLIPGAECPKCRFETLRALWRFSRNRTDSMCRRKRDIKVLFPDLRLSASMPRDLNPDLWSSGHIDSVRPVRLCFPSDPSSAYLRYTYQAVTIQCVESRWPSLGND